MANNQIQLQSFKQEFKNAFEDNKAIQINIVNNNIALIDKAVIFVDSLPCSQAAMRQFQRELEMSKEYRELQERLLEKSERRINELEKWIIEAETKLAESE